MKTCVCGTSETAEKCCELYIQKQGFAPTPEKLMRSRYTAYTQSNIDYIAQTMKGPAMKHFDPVTALQWAKEVQWIELKVLNAPEVKPGETKGFVEFIARYLLNGKEHALHEISEFHREDGCWYYYDGITPKINRNALCPCGSGKKYKKCCL